MKYLYILLLLLPLQLIAGKWIITHNIGSESVRSINCPDSNNCYIYVNANQYELIYKSTDQGKTWRIINSFDLVNEHPPSGGEADNVSSPNAGYYYISCWQNGIIKISSDSCKTFKKIILGTNQAIDEVQMLDSNFGIAISIWPEGFYYMLTHDNWKTFESYNYYQMDSTIHGSIRNPVFHNKDSISFLFDNGDNLGYEGIVNLNLITKQWRILKKYEDKKNSYYYLLNLNFVNDSLAFIAGGFIADTSIGNSSLDVILRTKDAGNTWEELLHQMGWGSSGLQQISFKDELHGIAVGQWGSIVRTNDGGDTWTYDSVPSIMNNARPATMNVAWAGSVPIVGTDWGIFMRYEEDVDVREPIIDDNIRIRQNSTQLLISVEDPAFGKYEVMIADIMGNVVKRQGLSSGTGVLFMPVNIEDLYNGTYLYIITKNGSAVKTGKFVVVR